MNEPYDVKSMCIVYSHYQYYIFRQDLWWIWNYCLCGRSIFI